MLFLDASIICFNNTRTSLIIHKTREHPCKLRVHTPFRSTASLTCNYLWDLRPQSDVSILIFHSDVDEETPLTESQNGIFFVRKWWVEKERVKLQMCIFLINCFMSCVKLINSSIHFSKVFKCSETRISSWYPFYAWTVNEFKFKTCR